MKPFDKKKLGDVMMKAALYQMSDKMHEWFQPEQFGYSRDEIEEMWEDQDKRDAYQDKVYAFIKEMEATWKKGNQ